jgi:hypothetical protein
MPPTLQLSDLRGQAGLQRGEHLSHPARFTALQHARRGRHGSAGSAAAVNAGPYQEALAWRVDEG